MLIDIMNDHGLEQLVHFLTREKIHWIYYSLLFLVSFGIIISLTINLKRNMFLINSWSLMYASFLMKRMNIQSWPILLLQ